MPANLNALIRYKQIDKCLRNRFVDCTIQKMQEMCSEALAEFRGVYKLVSERTIRDDIRVMRSEMLGFEAPIVFEDGKYFYSDPDYSIFNATIEEKELLKEVLQILLKEREKLGGSEVDSLLKRLSDVTGEILPMEERMEERISPDSEDKLRKLKLPKSTKPLYSRADINYSPPPDAKEKESRLDRAMRNLASMRQRDNALYWGYILEIL